MGGRQEKLPILSGWVDFHIEFESLNWKHLNDWMQKPSKWPFLADFYFCSKLAH